jgi:hypothetical protein
MKLFDREMMITGSEEQSELGFEIEEAMQNSKVFENVAILVFCI